MTDAGNGRKKIALWFSRVVFDESLRFAFPNAYYSRPTFMEDWHPLEVEQVSTSTLDWFPYLASAVTCKTSTPGTSSEEFNGGLDFIWRPNSSSQLTGAINPDFGQVESDDLVVNFSAFETFVTEKRPFLPRTNRCLAAIFAMVIKLSTRGGLALARQVRAVVWWILIWRPR